MNKKKMLVYDSSKGFSQFVKLNFSDVYDIDSFVTFNNPQKINFEDYDVGFFIVNESIELVDFIWMHRKISPLFLTTRLKELDVLIQKIDDVLFFDFTNSRREIIDFINFHLKTDEFNGDDRQLVLKVC